jgi:peptide/nickel transport system substrate-binding protein
MVEGHQIDEDGLIWTLRLRDGLRFHDKEPVLARDVVASECCAFTFPSESRR